MAANAPAVSAMSPGSKVRPSSRPSRSAIVACESCSLVCGSGHLQSEPAIPTVRLASGSSSFAEVAQRAGSMGWRYIVETGPVKILIRMCT